MRLLTLGGRQFDDCLRALGHEVRHAGPPGSAAHPGDRDFPFLSAPASVREDFRAFALAFRPDWILQVDDSSPLLHLGLEDLTFPKAWYAIDSHLHGEWHAHLAPLFDLVFVAQKNRLADLGAFRGGDAAWLPLAFPLAPEFLPWESRVHGACFVGTLDPALNPARAPLFAGLRERGVDVLAAAGEYQRHYRAARAVVNQSVQDDLNQRVFEAMGCGALLITDRISHSLEDIGAPGEDFLVYAPGDADELASRIRWALGHPREAEAIARRGHEAVVRSHRAHHRVTRVLEALSRPAPPPHPRGPVLGHLASAQEHVSRLALPGGLPAFFASEARRTAGAALAADPGEPWARLAMAGLDLERGAYADGAGWLEGIPSGEPGGKYHRRYCILRVLLLANAGRIVEARQAVVAARRAYPEETVLGGLARVLGV